MLGRFMIITGIIGLVVGIILTVGANIPDFAKVIATPFCSGEIETDSFGVYCVQDGDRASVTELLTMIGVGLTIVGSLDLAFGFVAGIAGLSGKLNKILENGESAQAIIIAIDRTGVTVNDQPMLKFRLQVQPNYGQAYEAETSRIIPFGLMPHLALGMSIPVKYMPDKPEDVALDLGAMQISPAGFGTVNPPKPKNNANLSNKLKELEESFNQGLINQEEYDDARQRILDSF